MNQHLTQQDTEVAQIITGEDTRQREGLELIPSENYVSQPVREAMASTLTNKYSEGYPGKRYYGGQEYTDQIENVARDRAKALFNCAYANVQPLGGANANIAMYFSLLEPGDTVLGMDLSHGGHLTHGHPVTAIAKVFNFVRYKMKDIDTGTIDFDELEAVAKKEKPKMILAGFSAYPRELNWQKFKEIADSVGAYAVADVAHIAGLIAGHAHENPFTYGFDVLTTTTHKTLRGPRGGMILTRESEEIAKKIDSAVFPGLQGGPHMHQIAAKAVCFKEANTPQFETYARQVIKNAKAMAEVFAAEDVRMITGGTDNHLILLDVYESLGISGKEAEEALDRVGITVNKNAIADDSRKPLDPSGIRLGTPAITTRGFTEKGCREVAECIVEILRNITDRAVEEKVRTRITTLAQEFPVPDTFV